MVQSTTNKPNLKLIDLEEWKSLLEQPNFKKVRVYISKRIESLYLENERLNDSPSLDTSIKTSNNVCRIKELKLFLSHIDFKIRMYFKYKKEGNNA